MAECNYSITKRVYLAVASFFVNFRPYLFGRGFKIVIDPQLRISLVTLDIRLSRCKFTIFSVSKNLEYTIETSSACHVNTWVLRNPTPTTLNFHFFQCPISQTSPNNSPVIRIYQPLSIALALVVPHLVLLFSTSRAVCYVITLSVH